MANTHTVVKGDTLWELAARYLGSGTKYTQLAAINGISSPYTIYIGQVLKLTSDGSSPTTSNSNCPTIKHFGLSSTEDNKLFAMWTWGKESTTKSYQVSWCYTTKVNGKTVEVVGNSSSISVDKEHYAASRQSSYTIPSGATKVTFRVKPIAEMYKPSEDAEEIARWTANWSDKKTHNVSTPPATPSGLSVEIKDLKLTATLENVDTDIDSIEFEVYKNDKTKTKTGKSTPSKTNFVSFECAVAAGNTYKVRCRAIKGSLHSDWTNFSESKDSGPAASSGIKVIKAMSDTAVYLEWAESKTATSYEIEYTTELRYFDGSDQTTTKTGIESTHFEITGLESGDEYFFRVRAAKGDVKTAWTEPKSIVIGKDPAAPTTWSSSTTVVAGEPLTLYWVHNSEDKSGQTKFNLEIAIDGVVTDINHDASKPYSSSLITYEPAVDDDGEITSGSCQVNTTGRVEGTKIQWRVRTAGITNKLGDWSTKRTVDIYSLPTLDLSILDIESNPIDIITSFPFRIYGLPGKTNTNQLPVGYHLTITADETYETVDAVGNPKTVMKGESVYSKHFDISEELFVEFSAHNIDLENSISYVATCTVSMNSGLTATASTSPFTVQWVDELFEPNAQIAINQDTYVAYIKPYCEQRYQVNYKVTRTSNKYTKTDESVGAVCGEPVSRANTTTGEKVYQGMDVYGNELYYCTVEEVTPVEDVLLSVYRREFNGGFTEIAKNIDASLNTTVTDPHPALDYARYRIVATTKSTGAVSYYDMVGYPVGCTAIIIQWDETWSTFEVDEGPLVEPPWTGSLLYLPYNVDVSDSSSPDVALVEYIGRSHPTSYYGTQIGQTSTWNVEIVKDDVETLYTIRRLAKWMGDVYVREPSGSGYWANITVSFSQKHGPKNLTIPVTFNITRVEGGV